MGIESIEQSGRLTRLTLPTGVCVTVLDGNTGDVKRLSDELTLKRAADPSIPGDRLGHDERIIRVEIEMGRCALPYDNQQAPAQ